MKCKIIDLMGLLVLGFLTDSMAEMSGHLRNLQGEFARYQQHSSPATFKSTDKTLFTVAGYVVVDITVKGDMSAVRERLTGLGMIHISEYKQLLSGAIPIDKLDQLDQLTGVSWVSSVKAQPRRVSVHQGRSVGLGFNSADPALFTDLVRKQYKVSGKGVIIGVISDSYNCLNGAVEDIHTGDLPDDVQILKDYPVCDDNLTDEGRAMMQLIHDIAPDAKLMFYTGFVSAIDFAQGILQLAAAGADIIVDDIGYFTMPMFQDGPIAQAVNDVTEQGVSYFSAAGNNGDMSYEANFTLGTEPLSADKAHDFGKAAGKNSNFYQKITIPAGTSITLSLQWDDPAEIAGGAGAKTDLDIFLLDSTQKRVVARGEDSNIGHNPVEFISVTVPDSADFETVFYLYISLRAGPAPTRIKYIINSPIAPPGSPPKQLKVLDVSGTDASFFFLDNTEMPSGKAVVAPFIQALQHYVLLDVVRSSVLLLPPPQTIAVNDLDGQGNGTINYFNEVFRVGPDTDNPIFFVPEGYVANILPNGRVELFVDGEQIETPQIADYATYSSTVFGHPNARGAIAVGAIDYQQTPWFNTELNKSLPENFSSVGGTPILFDSTGQRLEHIEYRAKPEIMAPDNTDTTFFPAGDLTLTDSDHNLLPNFSGTSAAAPHAAATTALLLESFPQLSPNDVREALMKGSLDLPDPHKNLADQPILSEQPCRQIGQFDWSTGCGLLQADLVFDHIIDQFNGVQLLISTDKPQAHGGIPLTYRFRVFNQFDFDLQKIKVNFINFPDSLSIQSVKGCLNDFQPESGCVLGDILAYQSTEFFLTVNILNTEAKSIRLTANISADNQQNLANTITNIETRVEILTGDLNQDGCIDITDWGLLFAVFRSGTAIIHDYDLNQDGQIDLDDLTTLEGFYSFPPDGLTCLQASAV